MHIGTGEAFQLVIKGIRKPAAHEDADLCGIDEM